MQVDSFNPKHCAHWVQVQTEYWKNKKTLGQSKYSMYSSLEPYFWGLIQSFTFIVLGYKFCWAWIPRALLEELSSQRRNIKSPKIRDTPNLFKQCLAAQGILLQWFDKAPHFCWHSSTTNESSKFAYLHTRDKTIALHTNTFNVYIPLPTHAGDTLPLAQARPMMLCMYTSCVNFLFFQLFERLVLVDN